MNPSGCPLPFKLQVALDVFRDVPKAVAGIVRLAYQHPEVFGGNR